MTDKIRISLHGEPRPEFREDNSEQRSKTWLIRPRHLCWVPILAGMWIFVAAFGTPHLRFSYSWTGSTDNKVSCDYVGYASQRISGSRDCPLIKFLHPVEKN